MSKKEKMSQATQGSSALAQKAMLVRLTCHWPGPWAADEKQRRDVEDRNGAKRHTSMVKKRVLGSALDELGSLILGVRRFNYFQTLPWNDDGWRVLSHKNYQSYMDGINDFRTKIEKAKITFRTVFPKAMEADRAELGTMWSAEAYEPFQNLNGRVGIEIRVGPIPQGEHFMVDVGEEELKKLRKSIDTDTQEQLQIAVKDIWTRFASVVKNMADKLKDYAPATDDTKASGIFRDSVVENIARLLDVVPALNVTGDPAIEKFAADIRKRLVSNSATVLRDDEKIRQETAAAADDILARMNSYLN